MSHHRLCCRCDSPAVTEMVPVDQEHAETPVVLVFPHWCRRCFEERFGHARALPYLRHWIGMERARDMIERETWRGL